MTAPTDLLERLAARIAAGETIDPAQLPAELLGTPELERLLSLARVAGALDANATAPSPAASTAADRVGAFRLVRLLGTGGMGEVWLGERADGAVEQRVALKRVRADLPQFGARLREERRILARLEHPNIARFIDAGVDASGAPWLAMEYVDGASITEWCRQRVLPLRDRLQLFIKVCAAVEHAHRHLVVHRDLKPSNVLVDASGEPKLLDFGIAKLLDGSGSEVTAAALTPAYAAPEQLRGGEISTATDVYALGLLLFRLLAGALPPTRAGSSAAAVLAHLDDEETERPSTRAGDSPDLPYAPRALEGDLDAIVAQAIRAEPEARYGSVAALAADVARHLDARPVRARAPTRWYRFTRFAARQRLPLALGALAVAALLAGTAVALSQAARAEREAAGARRELARAERVSEFLASLYREQDPLARSGARSGNPQAALAQAVARVGRELGDEPALAARLLRVLGEAQLNLGELDAARATLEHARSLAEGSGDPLLGATIDAVSAALALRELRQDDAERLFAQAHRAAVAARGADSIEAARIDASRALSLVQLSRFKDAREAAERADRVLSERLPANSAERINARVTFGMVTEQLREDAAAQAAMRSAIAAIESAYGAGDARLVVPLQTLGEVLRRARAFDEGRAMLTRGAAIARAQYGTAHMTVSNMLVRLATLERDTGDARRAIVVLDEAEAALPAGEIGARAQLLAIRGGTWIELGDGVRAEADLREAVRLRRDSGGLRNGLAWFNQAQLGEALMLQGRLDEADALQAEAARELRALLGSDAYQNALVAQRWSKTLDARGDFAGAAAQWREARRLVEKTYGNAHHGYFEMSVALAGSLSNRADGRAEATAIVDALLSQWSGNSEFAVHELDAMLLRCRLHLAAGERSQAVALARAALQRLDAAGDPERRASLQRIVDGR
jgi:hypothetical protein